MDQVYLFSVNPSTPAAMTVEPGEEFTAEVRGAFDDVEDIKTIPTPFTPESEGHPLAPITGPIAVRGAEPGDAVVIELIEITPHGTGSNGMLGAGCIGETDFVRSGLLVGLKEEQEIGAAGRVAQTEPRP